jgi:hypothetical protein
MTDNVDISIKAIVQGLDNVRVLVREIEKLPGAGSGIKELSAQFSTVQKNIEQTVKELNKAGNELRGLGSDTQRVMTGAGVATGKVPAALSKVTAGTGDAKKGFAELSQTAASFGNAITQALNGDILPALQSLATAFRSGLDFTPFFDAGAKGAEALTKSVNGSEKVLTRFSSLLGTAAKNQQGALSTTLFEKFGITAQQALVEPEVALKQFITTLSGMTEATDRAAAVAELFGASTASLLPTIEALVASELAVTAATDAHAAAQATAAAATVTQTTASEAAALANANLAAAQASGTATAAELTALESTAAIAAAELTIANQAATIATTELAVAEQALTVVTAEVVVVEEAATVATIGLASALGIAAAAILAVLAVAGGVILAGFAIGKSFSDAGSILHDMAEETGLTAEELSVLKLAADGSGSSLEKVAGSFQKYLRNVNEAAGGNKEAAHTFKQLGIDANAANKNSVNALEQLFKAISKIPPGAEQVNAAMKAAGKSGADLIPVINQAGGSFEEFRKRAEALGVVISTESANAADEFGDTLGELSAVVTGLKNQIGAGLLPTLIELTKSTLQFVVENKQGIADLASVIVTTFKIALGVMYAFGGTIAFLTNLIYGIINAIYALVVSAISLSSGVIQAGKALYQYLSGDIAGAVKTIEKAVADAKFAIADLNQELTNSANIIASPTFTSLFKLINGGDGSTPNTFLKDKIKPTGSFSGGGSGKFKKEKTDPEIKAYQDALLETEKTFYTIKYDLLLDANKREQAELTRQFKNNVIGYKEYYDQLTVLHLRENSIQILLNNSLAAVERKRLEQATKGSERLKIQADIDKIGAENNKLLLKQYDIVNEATQQRNDAEKEYLQMLRDVQTELLQIEGKGAAATRRELDDRFEKDLEKATAKGDTAGIENINKLKAVLAAQADFEAAQENINRLLTERDQQEKSLNQQVLNGVIARTQANAALKQFEEEQATKIKVLVADMTTLADTIGDPKLQQDITDIALGLNDWSVSQTTREVDDLKEKVSAAQNELQLQQQSINTQLTNNAITEQQAYQMREEAIATYYGKAFDLLAVLEAIAVATNNADLQGYVDKARADIASLRADGDDLAVSINESFTNAFTDFFSAIADGTKDAKEAFADFGRSIIKILADIAIKALITQLALKIFGGGGSGGAGGFLSGLFGGDKATGGKATGGYTGDGRTDEKQGYYHGQEFVVKAPYAKENLAFLEAMNNGLRPSRNTDAGGNVSPAATMQAGAAGQNINMVTVLPNDLLDNYIQSGSGTKTFLNMIEDNATAINGRLKQANG